MIDAEWKILFLGDIHLGNPGCDTEKVKRSVEKILNDPTLYWLGMGDYCENNNPDNQRSLATYDKEMAGIMGQQGLSLLSQQVRAIRHVFGPISSKCIGLLIGNHEDRTMTHDDFKLLLTEPLKVNYLGDKSYIALEFRFRGRTIHTYKLIVGHSDYAGQYNGTVSMAAQRFMGSYEDFDIFAFGHTHYSFADKQHRKVLDVSKPKPELKHRKFYILNTGTFLRSEVEGFDPYTDKSFKGGIREVGTVTASFYPSKGEVYAHA